VNWRNDCPGSNSSWPHRDTRNNALTKKMKSEDQNVRRLLKLLVAATIGVVIGIATVSAQTYSIDWFTIDSGGGTSAGGIYSVSGTIGQPDAGKMAGGRFTVEGGFWPGVVQTVGAPKLTISPAAPGQAMISWLPNSPGWILQETATLQPANWTNSPSGATNSVVVPATLPSRFYRLFKPSNN